MTTRPGAWPQEWWRKTRTKRVCNLVKLTRTNGEAVYMTDLDRALTFEGATYRPIVFAGMSAERREAAMRSGNQEAYGIIDGDYVVLPDLLGDRYRGAEVAHVITDFQLPLLVVARHRKWVRSVTFTGSAFVATLEGRTQVLTRPAGGRFGGFFTTVCPYKLGGVYCKKVLTGDDVQYGVRVATITKQRMSVTTTSATWSASLDDDYFRDGEMAWRWALPVETGQATAGITLTTLTDSGQAWTVDEHVGRECRILSGAAGRVVDYMRISANTATTLTFDGNNTYASGTHYDVAGFCDNLGHVSPIAKYVDGTRAIELLFPTPFPIAVGDSGIVKVGCNGLKTTCKDKFSNLDNFGGDAEAPSAGKVVKPAVE